MRNKYKRVFKYEFRSNRYLCITSIVGNIFLLLLITGLNVRAENNSSYNNSEKSEIRQGVVTGIIKDDKGVTLPGVNILEKGTFNGAVSGADGRFSINVLSDDAVLVFSFMGYESQEIAVGNRSTLDVILTESFLQLDEVVVTALGIEREKKALGYSVGEVASEDILRSNETNIVSALSGKVAGVAISTSSGQAGGAAHITIRGNSSINYNNQPLFVIDGVPFDNSETTIKNTWYQGGGSNTGMDIDPNNIASLTVLKGASASALYGSKASNGVVLITTKQGRSGQTRVNYSIKTSIDNIHELPLSTSWSQGEYVDGVPTHFDGDNQKTNNSWGPRISDVPGLVKYDKFAAFRTGHKTENSFNISGGGDRANYYASVTLLNQQGLLDPITFKKKNMFFKVNADVAPWLDASISFSYIRTDAERLNEGLSRDISFMCSILDMPNSWNPFPIYDESGNARTWTNSAYNNPYWMLENTLNTYFRNRFLPILGLKFKLAENLSLNTKVGIDGYVNTEDDFVNSGGRGGNATGRYNIQTNQYFNFNSDIMLTYKKQLMEDISLDLMVGNNVQSNRTDYTRIDGRDFIIPDFKHINNCQTLNPSSDYAQRRSVSVYGQAVLAYKSMIYYTFTGRNDWSSTLPPDDNSYFYSSNSIGFIFSELFESDVISFGKIRAAYSSVGNDAPPYSIYQTYAGGGGGGLTFPYNGVGTFAQSWSANNSALKNEMTKEIELGLEMMLINGRMGLETSVYKKRSFDQIVSADISNSTGFGAAMINVGEMENKGVELLIYGSPVRTKDFEWEVSLNMSANRNMVVKITDAVDKIGGGAWGMSIWEGYPYPVVELDYFITDGNGNDVIVDDPEDSGYGYNLRADRYKGKERPAGKVDPDWRGGIRNTLSYKGLTLSVFVDAMFGGYTHNMNEQYTLGNGTSPVTEERTSDGMVVWPGVKGHVDQTSGELIISGEPNDIPVSFVKAFQNQGYKFNAKYKMQKSDYIKLREVSLSYNLPKELMTKVGFIKGATITVSGMNLWHWFDESFTGSDPEYALHGSGNAQGMSIYMMPSYKSYNFGINLSF